MKEYLLRMEILFMRIFVFRIVRYSIGYLRYYIFRYIFKNIKKFSGDQGHLGLDTLEYNFKNIKRSITTHSRVYHMLYPLLALSYIDMNKQKLKVLTIGPRSEGEIFLIAAHGFRFSNITGIDLFSYSPKIEVGDMHSMHFKDNSFDIIFSGWVLAYSDDQEKALKEMVRVLKPGGYVTFGQGFDTQKGKNHNLGGKIRKNYIKDIFKPIKQNIDTFYFTHDITDEMANNGERLIATVFRIKKPSNI